MHRNKKSKGDEVSFQITPMIDMTFLLLIFFMITAKLSKESTKKEVRLPVAATAKIPDDTSQRIIINIDAAGNYFIGKTLADKKAMADYLDRRFKNFPPLRIYLRADKGTPAKKIKEFMKLAGSSGAQNVIFASYNK
jgi:biopolymer transport protein ExbD